MRERDMENLNLLRSICFIPKAMFDDFELSLDARVPVLGPANGIQSSQIQLPDGTILIRLNGLDKVLGTLSCCLCGMLIE